jgi:hypothetical protein
VVGGSGRLPGPPGGGRGRGGQPGTGLALPRQGPVSTNSPQGSIGTKDSLSPGRQYSSSTILY